MKPTKLTLIACSGSIGGEMSNRTETYAKAKILAVQALQAHIKFLLISAPIVYGV